MRDRQLKYRIALYAGVSLLALTMASAQVLASPKQKPHLRTPAPSPGGTLSVWTEGGAFWTGGAPAYFGIPTGYNAFFGAAGLGTGTGLVPGIGWNAAIGADYSFAGSPWHVSFDLRYGAAQAAGQNFTAASFGGGGPISAAESIGEHEDHLVADLIIGNNLGGTSQFKFGVRGAYLRADVADTASATGSGSGSCSGGGVMCSALVSSDERSSFIGVGPRAAVDGRVPLDGSWGIDYMGGAAVLFGDQQAKISGTAFSTSPVLGFGPTGPLGFETQSSDMTAVFNADASLALSYLFGPTALSAGFRFDGYWSALKTSDSSGGLSNVNRFYYGPFVRLSEHF